jgi:hypothetical protein
MGIVKRSGGHRANDDRPTKREKRMPIITAIVLFFIVAALLAALKWLENWLIGIDLGDKPKAIRKVDYRYTGNGQIIGRNRND